MKRLGVDIGSSYIKIVLLDHDNQLIYLSHVPHRGMPLKLIKQQIKELCEKYSLDKTVFGITGSGASIISEQLGIKPTDHVKALILSVQREIPSVRNIIDIGAGTATLITLDENKEFVDYSTNSLCAAGTGSFLDEQAIRLGISYDDMDAFVTVSDPPSVATRCAVFAKSDLIHLQQEGQSKASMWSGLCRGMTLTMMQTLLKGKPLEGKTVVVGGVSKNQEVVYWLKKMYPDQMTTYNDACLSSAVGAALSAKCDFKQYIWELLDEQDDLTNSNLNQTKRNVLELKMSEYPCFAVHEEFKTPDGTEVRVGQFGTSEEEVYLGLDIGSTSTKAVLLSEGGEVLLDLYRKTEGDPIQAVRSILKAITKFKKERLKKLTIVGCGTTGSGRKIVGKIIGADCIINEITAHVTGAMSVDDTIDTIFEIGGQDAKYMRTMNGRIFDSNMNFVCAAGTGSFIEEQANKLGIKVEEIGDMVMGVVPPYTSDRCTVFMEQDVNKLIRQGFSRKECIAAVLYSVVQNYLNKVVGNRYFSKKKIFFQGATARNKGLVAAFEKILGVEIKVSPYAHVMGALGVALMTKDYIKQADRKRTRFRGVEIVEKSIKTSDSKCVLCTNVCSITNIQIDGIDENLTFGHKCGMESGKGEKNSLKSNSLFSERHKLFFKSYTASDKRACKNKVIGIPLALSSYALLPKYKKFFNQLGFEVQVSPTTNAEIKSLGQRMAGHDFCFPVKSSYGHVQYLLAKESIDWVFAPHLIGDADSANKKGGLFCPYVTAIPTIFKSAIKLNDLEVSKLLTPIIDQRLPFKETVNSLFKQMGKSLNVTKHEIREAWREANCAQSEFQTHVLDLGKKVVEEAKENKGPVVVVIGRPYNLYDSGLNISIPKKLEELGLRVVPFDCIPFDLENEDDDHQNMYWFYGQKIISAIKQIKNCENLYPICLTNFGCGPDSFILSSIDRIMETKPYLVLELDEHGADAGYLTRIEAFYDVICEDQNNQKLRIRKQASDSFISKGFSLKDFKERKIWLPPMSSRGAELLAANFRAHGYDAEALNVPGKQALELGKSLTRGSECMPAALTIGYFIHKLRSLNSEKGKHVFFMPTASGPCRFGQYASLHRMILDKNGYKDIPILSPSADNSYMGLEESVRKGIFYGILITDLLNSLCCRIRPYEKLKGSTDKVFNEQFERILAVIERKGNLKKAFSSAVKEFEFIERDDSIKKPLVGVVGEIYVRSDEFSNSQVIRAIENYGGEAWPVPISEWVMYTSYLNQLKIRKSGLKGILNLKDVVKNYFLNYIEHLWTEEAQSLIGDRPTPKIEDIIQSGGKYFPIEFGGEAILTVGRTMKFIESGVDMVVNCAPFSCMPGNLSNAVFQEIQKEYGTAILTIFYDGESDLNKRIEVFLNNIIFAKKRFYGPINEAPVSDQKSQESSIQVH